MYTAQLRLLGGLHAPCLGFLYGDVSAIVQDMINRTRLLMDPHARAVKQSHVLNIHGKEDVTVCLLPSCQVH